MKVYLEERLKRHIIDGERIGLEEQPSSIPSRSIDGMKVVGELFGPGKCSCHLYQSALKQALAYLEPFMDRQDTGNNARNGGDCHSQGMSMILVRTSWISFCLRLQGG